jgi:ubiquinol-cytochrome c reductase cytochrome c1 subunit
VNKLVETKFESDEKANAFAIGVKGLARLEQDGPNSYKVLTLASDTDGKQTRGQYEASVTDLVNFLDYIAEPAKVGRVRLGYIVLMFLGVLLILAYLTKREIWKDLH